MTAATISARSRRLPISGGLIFMISAALVHAGNYAFNMVLGRRLGPALFSELSLIVTLLLVVTFGATTVQTTAARFVAVSEDSAAAHQLHRWLLGSLRPVTIGVAALMVGASPWLSEIFRLSSPLPLALFATGIPLYVSQAVHRGVVQGEAAFLSLAGSYQAEMWVRLLGGMAFVAMGWSVAGAAGAITLSFGASWLVVSRPLPQTMPPPRAVRGSVRRFAGKTALLLVGEILICHSDLIIAKVSLDPSTAGAYAAVSLIGRVVFFGTWPVVAFIFPLAARRQAAGRPPGRLLAGALALVGGVSLLLTAGALVAPARLLELAFGPDYVGAAPWLWPYVAATGCFALANTVFSYHLARGVTSGALLALGGGIAQVAALSMLNGSVAVLVWTQLTLMVGLLAVTTGWHLRVSRESR